MIQKVSVQCISTRLSFASWLKIKTNEELDVWFELKEEKTKNNFMSNIAI